MTTELTFILVTGGVAALVGVGALVAVLRERTSPDATGLAPRLAGNGSEIAPLTPSHEAVVRVVWWIAIAGVMVGIGLADPYPSNREAIYALGGTAALLVVVLHELLPRPWRGRAAVAFEVLAALALSSGLVWLTGRAGSPFVFTYHLVAVAAALTMGSRLALLVAVAASLAYLGQLGADSGFAASSADLLRVGINLGSLWLLSYLAGVYASAERRVRARVFELSRTDPLTGLFNRAQLFPTLDQEVQRTRRSGRGFCVLMIDVDGLKAINDSAGHLRGDEVLRSVGRVILGSVRGVDSAYRYGGDEFLIMLPETEFIGAYVVAEKIREGVEEVSEVLGTDASTSVSIGLVSYPEDGSSSEELMTAADRAMYQAKSLGKNQISGNPRPRRIGQRRASLTPDALTPPMVAPTPDPIAVRAAPSPARSFPVPSGQINGSASPPAAQAAHESHGEDEPDPADVRRQIAAARRNMDPDHQIRRAMDAFLSTPSARPGDPS